MEIRSKIKSISTYESLPLALLLLALSTIFIFGGDRGNFYKRDGSPHNGITARTMSLAANLSPQHDFLLFERREESSYTHYNRFPIGAYALTKLAIAPFRDNLTAQLYMARTIMLVFSAAAAVLAYLALRRLTSMPWIALTATLLAFSSYYYLYYNDMVSVEVPSIFGIMLTFHGMCIFMQDGRFRQLLIKTCIALLLGWHVMSLLLPFIVFGLARHLLIHRGDLSRIRSIAASTISSRYSVLGIVAAAFCAMLLVFNIGREYLALNGETSVTQLPTVVSYSQRLGIDDRLLTLHSTAVSWDSFLLGQISRIGAAAIPYTILQLVGIDSPPRDSEPISVLAGALVLAASLLGLVLIRHRILVATLLLSGLSWILLVRTSTATHEFEALFHLGVVLVFFSASLLLAHTLLKRNIVIAWGGGGLAAAALVVFMLSSFDMGERKHDAESTRFWQSMLQDFRAIHQIIDSSNETITVITNRPQSDTLRSKTEIGVSYYVLDWYLSQRSIRYSPSQISERGYTIMATRIDSDALLTPDNQQVFLYDSDNLLDLYHSRYRTAVSGDVLLVSNFSVYSKGDTLYYVKDGCTSADIDTSFYAHFVPADPDDIPPHHRQYGFQTHNFDFVRRGVMFDEKCMVEFTLPPYDPIHIEVGQIGHDSPGQTDIYDQVYNAAKASEPVIRSKFDVYFDGEALTYINDSCGIHDIEPSFFLHIFPADENALSEQRRQYGYDNRDFYFKVFGGVVFQGKCLVSIIVPQYDIAQISTGQTSSSEGTIWSGQAHIGE